MLQAKKSRFIEWGFTRFNRWFLRSHFQHIRLIDDIPLTKKENTLFIINHSSWWDPLMIFYLNEQVLKTDGYGMMHKEGIQRYPFFRKIGAYSIDPDDRKHLIHSLKYSTTLLKRGKSVWIFPQGSEQHLEKRPLDFFTGISYIIKKCPEAQIVPVSLYYSLEHSKKPNAYIQLGEPLQRENYEGLSRQDMTRYFEHEATEQLDGLKDLIVNEKHERFREIGKKGENS